MAVNRAVHECLFCPQVFDSAAAKDDHVLEHFTQGTCADCHQNLIRIGGNSYVLHGAATCIKTELKTEEPTESCLNGQSDIQHFQAYNFQNRLNSENQCGSGENIETDVQIKTEPQEYDEDLDLQQDVDDLMETICEQLESESTSSKFQQEGRIIHLADSNQNYSEQTQIKTLRVSHHEQLAALKYPKEGVDFLSEEFNNLPGSSALQKHLSGSVTTFQTENQYVLHATDYSNQNPICDEELQMKTELTEPITPANETELNAQTTEDQAILSVLKDHSYSSIESTLVKSKRSGRRSQCNICGRYLSSKLYVRRHKILVHTPIEVIHCDFCSKIFSTVQERDIHRPQCILKSLGET